MDRASAKPPRRGIGARLFGRSSQPPRQPEPEPEPSEPTGPDETEFLEAAVAEFERRLADVLKQAGEDLYTHVERGLAATEARLRETERRLETTVSDRLDGAIAEVRVQGDTQLEYERERVHEAEALLESICRERREALREVQEAADRAEKTSAKAAAQNEAAAEKPAMRARRQELKLVREENSKRITAALSRLERQAEIRTEEVDAVRREAGSVLGEVDARITAASESADELERRFHDIGGRLADTERRTEGATAAIADAVVKAEAEAARRISDAERRLLQRVDPGERG